MVLAHCWRLGLAAGGAGRHTGSTEGLWQWQCYAVSVKQKGLLVMLCSAGGDAMVSLKALRVPGGSTGSVEPCDGCWRAPGEEVMSLAWEMCLSFSFSLFFNGM